MAIWFKWYENTTSDPKFRVIARRSGQPLTAVISIWAALLERASESPDRGSLDGFDCVAVDAGLDIPDGATASVVNAMADYGMIANGRIAKWEDRQSANYDSNKTAKTSTERSREFRARKKAQEMAAQRNTMQHNATDATDATLQQHNATDATIDKNRIEKIIGEENKNTYSSNLFEGWSSTLTNTSAENTPPQNMHPDQPDAQPEPDQQPTLPDDIVGADTTQPKKSRKATAKKPQEPKESYGEYGNVKMTKDEYHKLLEKFGDELAHSYIDQLDLALGTKNYGYKSHYMAILKWERSGYFNNKSRPQYRKTTGFDMDEARQAAQDALKILGY